MNWTNILQTDPGDATPLPQRIHALFAQQRETWPALREGEAALAGLRKKNLTHDGSSIVVQVNPARRRSTLANTDAQAIAARPCFLCPQNMPPEERGIAFEDLVILPNPFPILPMHCTIPAREHVPQQLAGRVAAFLRLAAALGPDMVALYNGPRCGASAPDHFHFQAARAADIPLLNQLPPLPPAEPAFVPHHSFGRNLLVFHAASVANLQAALERALQKLQPAAADHTQEPMLNLLAHFSADHYTATLFPRAAHRPACYFAPGDDQLAISPAVLEMSGILVTTNPAHFDRLDAPLAKNIYEEVSIPPTQLSQLLAT